MKKLKRTKQCAKCPWKVSTNPCEIPNVYDVEGHKNLKNTIATPGEYNFTGELRVMACHESTIKDSYYCVGWLYHQMGKGNNIGLRLQMLNYTNAGDIQVFGEQHSRFEDTLPQE